MMSLPLIELPHCTTVGCDRPVQFVPSGDVEILAVPEVAAAATKSVNSEDQHTPDHAFDGIVRLVQFVPSGEVWQTPVAPTDTNSVNPDAQQTLRHPATDAAVRFVQLVPSGEVMTRFVPSVATATSKVNAEDQQTPRQLFACEAVRVVHVTPSGDVKTQDVVKAELF